MTEIEIMELNKLLLSFENQIKLQILPKISGDKIELVVNNGEYELVFNARVIHFINKARISLIYDSLKNTLGKTIIITDYINPILHQTMVDLGINYIDACGNSYINYFPMFINTKGNKRTNENVGLSRMHTFNAAGLQVIFAFLCNSDVLNYTMAEIARLSKTAVGTAFNTIKALTKQSFVSGVGKEKELINYNNLLTQWIMQYPGRLKPKVFYGRYLTTDEKFRDNADVKKYGGLWGGETAASKLTNYLTPYYHTLYFSKSPGEFILRNKLKVSKSGNIEILYAFWDNEINNSDNDIVNPILIYADLMNSGDSRNIETANIIYEKEIVRYLK